MAAGGCTPAFVRLIANWSMSRSETTPPNSVGRLSSLVAIREPTVAIELTDCYLQRKKESNMLNKTEQSDRAPNANEKQEDCYCSALPKGSGLCLPCYTRWLRTHRTGPSAQ